jgi:TRAP-type C4-dicarboxylate transport system permease small subunit
MSDPPFGRDRAHAALSAFDRAVGKLAWFGAVASGLCINALVLMILAQVFSRNVLDLAFAFVLDIGGWLFVAISFLAFGWALREQAHIRMTALTEKLRPTVLAWFDIAAGLVALGFCAFFLLSIWRNLAQAWRTGVTAPGALDVPIYPVWAAALIGVILLALQFAVELLRDVQAIATGRERISESGADRQVGDI